MRFLGVQGRGHDPVKDRQGRLDQARHPGRRHGVTDHRRDGTERPAPIGRWREHGVQGSQLGPVGGRDAQPMPFDEHHGRGIDPRPSIRAADRAGMTAGARHGQAPSPAVARHAEPLHHGVDPIAVALGIAPALEDHHAHAFAREHPVGIGRERPGDARGRHRPQLPEDQREVDVGLDIDPADDGQVGPTLDQGSRRQVERDQRRGAGGVHHEGRSAQVQAMGEASGRGVGELAGDRGRLERRQPGLQLGSHRFPIGVRPIRVEGRQDRQRLSRHPPVLEPGQVASIEVIPAADHHFDPTPRNVGRVRARRRRERPWRHPAPGTARALPLRRSAA